MKPGVRTRPIHQPGARQKDFATAPGDVEGDFELGLVSVLAFSKGGVQALCHDW
jgi:hypothetical protein